MKIAMIVETFPSSKEVPVLNQICGLIDAGMEVRIFALNRDPESPHPKFLDYGLDSKTRYIEKNPINRFQNIWLNRIWLRLDAWTKILALMPNAPGMVLSSLNRKKYGKLTRSFFLFYLMRFFRKMEAQSDIILCQFAPMGVIGAALRDIGALQGKLVTAFRGYGINVYPKTMPSGYYDRLMVSGDAFAANSEDTKNGAVKLGFPEEKIHLVHSTLNVNEFSFRERSYNESQILTILSVGSLIPVKGHEFAIRAMQLLKKAKPGLKFVYRIVGTGDLRDELRDLVAELELQNEVAFEGFFTQDRLIRAYLEAHIYLHPSVHTETGSKEAQGLVIQEAQATGLPVIASRIGGIPDGLLEGKSGLLVPEKDPNAILDAILNLISIHGNWPEMGREGRRFVESNYDVRKQTDKLINVFENIIRS